MALKFTAVGVWQEEHPALVAVFPGSHDVYFGDPEPFGNGIGQQTLWVTRIEAGDPDQARRIALDDITQWRENLCATPECRQSTANSAGNDGRCADCSARIYALRGALNLATANEAALQELQTELRRINLHPAHGRLSGIARTDAADAIRPLLEATMQTHAHALKMVGVHLAHAKREREQAQRAWDARDLIEVTP